MTKQQDDITRWLKEHLPQGQFGFLQEHGELAPRQLAKAAGVSPQVIYSYIRTGRIGCVYNSSGKKMIPKVELYRYLQKRLDKQQAKADQLERELKGLA